MIFGIFSTFFALFETDIYTRAMIFNSYYGRCFLKGFFFANFCFCFIEEFESSKVLRTMFFEGGKQVLKCLRFAH